MTPEWGTKASDLPPETQFFLAELAGDGAPSYVALLPLLAHGRTFRATLRPASIPPHRRGGARSTTRRAGGGRPRPADLALRIESGDAAVAAAAFPSALLVAPGTGPDPLALADAAVLAAASLSGPARPRTAKGAGDGSGADPHFMDAFGWCTWDAFYSEVSARGVADGVAALRSGGAPPRFVIVDDGWQVTALDPGLAPITKPADVPRVAAEVGVLLAAAGAAPGNAVDSGAALSTLANAAAAREAVLAELTPSVSSEDGEGGGGEDGEGGGEGEVASRAVRSASGTGGGPPRPWSPGAAGRVSSSGGARTSSRHAHHHQPPLLAPLPALLPAVAPDEPELADPAALARLARPSWRRPGTWAPALRGWARGTGEVIAAGLYKSLLELAPPGSPVLRWFARLAGGPDRPLGPPLLSWYAATSDHVRRLADVGANAKFAHPGAGPAAPMAPGPRGGLASVVAALRADQGVKHVLCWHSLYGYWAGVVPGGPEKVDGDTDPKSDKTLGAAGVPGLAARLVHPVPSPGVLDVDPCYAWSPQVLSGVGIAADPAALFGAMHAFLAESGVDGVKVDCQATLGMIGSAKEGGLGGGPALAATFHDALEASISKNFPQPGNAAINCMCHTTEALYSFTSTSIVRASDDFWPRDPASHTAHVAVCAFNSAFLAPLATPDWDMFHSAHPAGLLHAAARVVSGGPIYVSDRPGAHDFDLLARLVLRDGRVLRPHRPGRPAPGCVFSDVMRDGVSLLKVQTVTGGPRPSATTKASSSFSFQAGLVGVFNTQGASWDRATRRFALHGPAKAAAAAGKAAGGLAGWWKGLVSRGPAPPLTTAVGPADVPGLPVPPSGRFLAWRDSARTGALLDAGTGLAVEGGAPLTISLSRGEAELVTLIPAYAVGGSAAHLAAPIGLVDMMNPVGALLAVDGGGRGGGGLSLRVRGRGRLGVWCTAAPARAAFKGGKDSLVVEYDAATSLATVVLEDEGADGEGGGLDAPMPDVDVVFEWA
jgi:raffinose synthase